MDINPEYILSAWKEEIQASIINNGTLSVAIFESDGKLIFANEAIRTLFAGEPPYLSLLNPTFEKLAGTKQTDGEIYNGYITFGNYSEVNSSIMAQVYRKGTKLLIIGGVDSMQLMHQNIMMHNLNREINNLQRQLIKEKHNLEQTLNQLNATNNELNFSNATKDKFFSIIAHDLKNPFSVLIGFSDLLVDNANDMDSESLAEILSHINQTSKSTYALLDDLLMWSRNQLGKIKFSPDNILFSKLYNDVVNNLSDLSRKKGINIQVSGDEPLLFCDPNMIKTVLRNLLTNAIKFSFDNSTVQIIVKEHESHAIIEVKDEGVGIEPSRMDSLWKIGDNNSTPGTHNESGTGLGLVLCKEFIEMHNGEIWVTSTLGKGSSFYFSIPKR
ncbi:MAG: HAMP domain-containing sensor histidine kinase [Bacteroidales bacterium]|jgi:signal transduction histidine kinase|nr:HAMP domain-containing sensor histidine kinase [Bacteroidales bacterium]MDD3299519.1 HAMP domain-containing sensor histidine kinase [Bacteroidales bacterium]MDD3844201.1 HAMP domain-containing sensor histidine kinase [Bacteroidales bacterium]MDD4617847.1 HAMP domain-containing sensor histidine kinase [Bacteroidales bacterium]